jgi:hypothetical protein
MAQSKDKPGAYLLRLVSESDRDIWRRARSRAVLEGRPIRDVIIELLDKWAYDGGFVSLPKGRRKRRD